MKQWTRNYPHSENPQLLQMRQPSLKINPFGSPQLLQVSFMARVPSGINLLRALATPFFQVLICSLLRLSPEIKSTTNGSGIPWRKTPDISFA